MGLELLDYSLPYCLELLGGNQHIKYIEGGILWNVVALVVDVSHASGRVVVWVLFAPSDCEFVVHKPVLEGNFLGIRFLFRGETGLALHFF